MTDNARMEENSLLRLISVLLAPTKTFKSIAERPTWLAPLILYSLLGLAFAWVAVPKIDWETSMRDQLEKQGVELSAEQLDTQLEVGKKFGAVSIYVFSVLNPWIVYPLLALLFLGLAKLAGSEMPFKSSLAVQCHGWAPWLVASFASLPVLLGRRDLTMEDLESGVLMSNLGFLASSGSSPTVTKLLESVDLFSLWTIFLFVIGYHVVGKVSRATAAIWVVGGWAVWVTGKVVLASFF